jgi:4,5-DOPA dioxygenase extradiol
MNREEFISTAITGFIAMNTLKDLKKFSDSLHNQESKMPLLFVGHGSPMNGIEDNAFSERWHAMGNDIQKPKAVLVISAHWFTKGTQITAMETPKTIHDFYGFPKALFDVEYPAPGNPLLAKEVASLIHKTSVGLDHDWGLDHGTWSVVKHMYPNADIPVLQLSIDYTQKPQYHYELAAEMETLRSKGVLIIGSGNMVHNLGILDWKLQDKGYDWAVEMNDTFKTLIAQGDHKRLINYEHLGSAAKLSIPTPEHYLPMLYILGLQASNENIQFFNDKTMMGSISMTSFKVA